MLSANRKEQLWLCGFLATALLSCWTPYSQLVYVVFRQHVYVYGVIQSCSLGLDVSVSRPSRDVFFKHLVSVSAKCREVSVSSRTESQTSRSRLGLGPQGLVYKWTFKQIFQFLSFSHSSSVGLHLFNDELMIRLQLCDRLLCSSSLHHAAWQPVSLQLVRPYNETHQISSVSVTKEAGKACVS